MPEAGGAGAGAGVEDELLGVANSARSMSVPWLLEWFPGGVEGRIGGHSSGCTGGSRTLTTASSLTHTEGEQAKKTLSTAPGPWGAGGASGSAENPLGPRGMTCRSRTHGCPGVGGAGAGLDGSEMGN